MKTWMIRLMTLVMVGTVLSACSSTSGDRETASEDQQVYKPTRGERF